MSVAAMTETVRGWHVNVVMGEAILMQILTCIWRHSSGVPSSSQMVMSRGSAVNGLLSTANRGRGIANYVAQLFCSKIRRKQLLCSSEYHELILFLFGYATTKI